MTPLARARIQLAAAGAAMLLAGCTSLAPQYERPPLAVPERFPRAESAVADAPSVAELQWRDVFVDARQRSLIELALRNNRDLRVAALNVEQALARAQAQRASLWPTIGAGISATRQPLPGGTTQEVYSAGLVMTSYEIDFFGRLRSLSEAAQAQVLAAEQSRRTAQMSLVAAVAAGHLALLADDELVKLTQQTLDTRIQSMQLIKLRYDSGTASELDYQLAQSVVANARATLLQLQRQRELDRNALVLLLGAPLPADTPTGADTLATMAPFPALPVGLSAGVLQRRPDIAAAEQQLIAANFNIGAARAAFFPSVTLTASAGSVSDELTGLFKGGTWGWGAAPQLLQILFDSGRNAANTRLAEATRDAAIAQYDRAIQSAFREVADALAGRDTLGEQTRALQEQTNAELARLRVADLRYRNGVASSLDLLDAQRSLFTVQQQAVLAQLAQAQNQVLLYKALGGGWSQADATTTTSSATR